MKRTITAILLAIALLASFAACGGNPAKTDPTTTGPSVIAPAPVTVTLLVTLSDGTQKTRTIITEGGTLGQALDGEGLIERDATGMIVKVDGVEASWEADQAYWALYINGAYAMKGADEEILADGNTYEFRYTKG